MANISADTIFTAYGAAAGTTTIDRPKKKSTPATQMYVDLTGPLIRFEASPTVQITMITGDGSAPTA